MNDERQLLDQTILLSLLVIEKVFPILGQGYKEDLTFQEFYTVISVSYFGEMKMTDFADDLGIKKQQATRIINSLVEKGFIERSHEESDRRIIRIGLTPHAGAYLGDYFKKTALLMGDSINEFSQAELKELMDALGTINGLLKKI